MNLKKIPSRCLLFSLFVTTINCHYKSLQKFNNNKKTESGFKVYKIDSIKSVYLIYARNKNQPYKILSHKEPTNDGGLIKINSYYNFKLVAIFNKKYDLVDGTVYYDAPVEIEQDSILTLYSAENVVGLHFVDHLHLVIPPRY